MPIKATFDLQRLKDELQNSWKLENEVQSVSNLHLSLKQ